MILSLVKLTIIRVWLKNQIHNLNNKKRMDHHLLQKIKVELQCLNNHKSNNLNNLMKLRKLKIFIGKSMNQIKTYTPFFYGEIQKMGKNFKRG